MFQGLALELVIGLVVVLGFALLACALGTVLAGRTRYDLSSGTTSLRYGTMFIGTGAVLSLVSTGLLVFFAFGAEVPVREWWSGIAVFGTMTGVSYAMLLEGFRRRVTLDDHGISVRGWSSRERRVRWNEVVRLENKVASSKFVVRTETSKLSISHHLGGLDLFIQECRSKLAPEVYGKELEKPLNRHLGI